MDRARICMAQTTSFKGGKEHNLARAERLAAEAAAGGADLVMFPEMYLTGYTAGHEIHELAEDARGASFVRMAECAAKHGIHILYGYPERRGQSVFNSANLIDDKGMLTGSASKTHLFEGERKRFTAGDEYPVFDTAFGKTGIEICYDIEFPEPSRRLAAKGAKLILCIAADMFPCYGLHDGFAKCRARENHVIIAYCNYAGSDDQFTYVGQSGVYDPYTSWLRPYPPGGERLVFEDIDFGLFASPGAPVDYLSHLSSEDKGLYTDD